MKFSFLSLSTVAFMATTLLMSAAMQVPVHPVSGTIFLFVLFAYFGAWFAEETSQL